MPKNKRKQKKSRSSKRGPPKQKKNHGRDVAGSEAAAVAEEPLVFEDPFADEYEEEDLPPTESNSTATTKFDDDDEEDNAPTEAWNPMDRPLEEGEHLNYDSGAYTMYHSLRPEWPCLSFDIIRDNLGGQRTKFPFTTYLVSGSQADQADRNQLTVMKISELHKTQNDEDSDAESDLSDLDDDPIVQNRSAPHPGCTNRIRCMPQKPNVVATWADTGKVHVWDISVPLNQLSGTAGAGATPPWRPMPVFTFGGHATEGYAMDWSSTEPGRMVTGDCNKSIHLWNPAGSAAGSAWTVDNEPYVGHTASVEDLQWSPSEKTVFVSCGVDKTVRVWDTRSRKKSMLAVKAHETDVNVIAWNRLVSYLVVSGSDDGSFKIWDLRAFKADAPAAHFKWHTDAINSVAWHPSDDSVLAVASADNTISLWDMSVEADSEEQSEMDMGDKEQRRHVPPQMLFLHQGQRDPKEVRFHSQIPGVLVSTAADGFNLFKPMNL